LTENQIKATTAQNSQPSSFLFEYFFISSAIVLSFPHSEKKDSVGNYKSDNYKFYM